MRHQIAHHHFNRDSSHRKALLKNLVRSLVVDGTVVTTTVKAKELKRLADKMIHQAQTDTITSRRTLHRFFGRRDVVNTLIEQVAPAMKDRVSGFTTISAVANRRGDNADLSQVELLVKPELKNALKAPTKKVVAAKKTVAVKAAKVEAKETKTEAKPAKTAAKTKTKTVKK